MRRFLVAGLAVAAAASFALREAQAEDLIKTITAARAAELIRDAGYRAEVVQAQPRGYVRSAAGGYTVLVFFYDCRDDNCQAIQYYTGIRKHPKFTRELTERWNGERRYGKAFLSKSGDLRLVYDIDLRAGVSPAMVRQGLLQFEALLARFDEMVRNTPEPGPAAAASEPPGEIAVKAQEVEALAAQGKYVEAVHALDSAADALWVKAPLSFVRALWVAAPPDGFGAYNPRESNVFASGVQMYAYAEPVGFGWRQDGELFHTDLSIGIVVKDKAGEVLLQRDDFGSMKISSRVRNREFMARFNYSFKGITKGEYLLDTVVHDKVTGKSGTFTLPFSVR